ncbi:DUF222 domain-containing protein [Streptomyces boninensis]|uniref:HNH endonuclease signature motif containing protein n=1 Tax=Streptomyces boninensis TaxID=2039455 RepID=UPI003B22030B
MSTVAMDSVRSGGTRGVRQPELVALAAILDGLAAEPGGWVQPIDGGYGHDEEALQQLGEDTLALLAAADRLKAEALRRLGEFAAADGPVKVGGCRDTATWLRARRAMEPARTREAVADAATLVRLPATAAAAGAGTVTLDQAKVVARTTERIGLDAHPQEAAAAEEFLLKAAGADGSEPVHQTHLHTWSKRLIHTLTPDQAQTDLDRAEAAQYLTITQPVAGLCDIRGRLTEANAEILRIALEAATERQRRPPVPETDADAYVGDANETCGDATHGPVGETDTDEPAVIQPPAPGTAGKVSLVEPTNFVGDFVERGRQRAVALTDLARLALATGELPASGGIRPQVIVRITQDTLTSTGEAPGETERGTLIPAHTARAYACDANIRRLITDPDGAVLDLGRAQRVVTHHQRQAVIERDRGCIFPGCDRPPRWCEVHHITEWQHGGTTDLPNLALLCTTHHHDVHRYRWHITPTNNGGTRPHIQPPEHAPPPAAQAS